MTRRALVLFGLTGLLLGVSGSLLSCGYHVGGKADLMPKSIQTICIPAFSSMSVRYKLTDVLPQQIAREFMSRTRFRIENDPNLADAVLHGSVDGVFVAPNILDPTTAKATNVQVTVTMSLRLVERATGRELYARKSFPVRENYNIAVDPHQFLDDTGPAFQRLSETAARAIVSAVVENF